MLGGWTVENRASWDGWHWQEDLPNPAFWDRFSKEESLWTVEIVHLEMAGIGRKTCQTQHFEIDSANKRVWVHFKEVILCERARFCLLRMLGPPWCAPSSRRVQEFEMVLAEWVYHMEIPALNDRSSRSPGNFGMRRVHRPFKSGKHFCKTLETSPCGECTGPLNRGNIPIKHWKYQESLGPLVGPCLVTASRAKRGSAIVFGIRWIWGPASDHSDKKQHPNWVAKALQS